MLVKSDAFNLGEREIFLSVTHNVFNIFYFCGNVGNVDVLR